jgi:hypothetical protein
LGFIDARIAGLTFIILLFSMLIHSIAGFGYAQVAMGLLPLVRNPKNASIIFTITAVASNFAVTWTVRKEFKLRDWGILVAGLIFGLPLGVYLFTRIDVKNFNLAIALTLFLAVALLIGIRKLGWIKDRIMESGYETGWKTALITGFTSGFLGGLVGIPGPPMIIYGAFQNTTGEWSSDRMKAIFTAFFGTLMVYRLANQVIQGVVVPNLLFEALLMLPALAIGGWIGVKIYQNIPERDFSWLVIGGLAITAFILFYRSITT